MSKKTLLLADAGLSPDSVTVDGNPQQIKHLRLVWPLIVLQRCLVHVQRQGLSWCRRNPKRTDAKHLREIFLRISAVKTTAETRQLVADVVAWGAGFTDAAGGGRPGACEGTGAGGAAGEAAGAADGAAR